MTTRILVTGAGGLIGADALSFLRSRGFDAMALYRKTPAAPVEWPVAEGDLAVQSLSTIVENSYDVIVHCAAQLPRSADEFETVALTNKEIDNNVLRFTQAGGARIIYLSGTSVYGMQSGICTEDCAVDPPNAYLKEKTIIEQNLIKHTNAAILRVSSPYSPRQVTRSVLKIFIEKALQNQPITYHGSGERRQDFIAVEDVSRAIHACITKQSNGIFNIAAGQSISMKNLARLIVGTVSGCTSSVKPSGRADEQENYRPQISIEKAKHLLGWEPAVPLAEGIQRWVDHLQNENRHSI